MLDRGFPLESSLLHVFRGRTSVWMTHLLLLGLGFLASGSPAVALEPPTAQERVEAVERALEDARKESASDAAVGESQWVEVKGRLLRPNGEPLENAYANLLAFSDRSSTNATLRTDAEGWFRRRVQRNATFHITVRRSDGLAARGYGPFRADADPVELEAMTAQPGFSGKLRFVDPEGEPIAGVRVLRAILWVGRGSESMGTGVGLPDDARSDADGLVRYEHVSDQRLVIEAWKPGYQFSVRELAFEPGEVIEWTLQPARPTIGRIVDAATGEPLDNAEVWLAGRRGYHQRMYDPRETRSRQADRKTDASPTQRLATTDADGKFSIRHWRDDAKYSIVIFAENHRPLLLNGLQSGQDLGDLQMKPPLYLEGRIVGNLQSLQQGDQRILRYRNDLTFETHGYSGLFETTVDEDGRFRIEQLVAGDVDLLLRDAVVQIRITKPIDDWTLDLEKPQAPPADDRQKVLVHLRGSAGQPLKGSVQLHWVMEGAKRRRAQGKSYENFSVSDAPLEWYVPAGATLWINDVSLVGSLIRERKLGTVEESASAVEFDAVLDPAGAVTGRLCDADGSPVRDFQLQVDQVLPDGNTRFRIASGRARHPDGRFALDGLPLGPENVYRLFFTIDETHRIVFSDPFHVTADMPVAEVDVQATEPLAVTGRVVDSDGSPLPDRRVSLSYTTRRTSRSLPSALTTDADGRFATQLSSSLPTGGIRLNLRPSAVHAGRTIELSANDLAAPRDLGEIQLADAVTMTGIVVGVDGAPKVEARLTLFPANPSDAQYQSHYFATTDEEGRFELEGVEPVRQRLIVHGDKILEVYGAFEINEDALGNKRWTVLPHASNPETTIIVGKSE